MSDDAISFTVLYKDGSEFKRDKTTGKILSVDKAEIVVTTSYQLKPGQMLKWVDVHKKGNLHFALVKWSKASGDICTAGLSIL